MGLGIKKFIKAHFITEDHPYLMGLWLDRWKRKMLAEQEAHSHMTYAEIEAAIGRRYQEMFGRTLNWENPQTYNEKIHVSKLYMPTPLKTRLADKVAVCEWIAGKIGSEYLIPLLGVYDSFDEIDFDALPDQFVIKCNHDSGSVTLVKDKRSINRDLLRKKYDLFLKRNFGWQNWEMQYRDIPPKMLVEKYIEQLDGGLLDYKVHCFNGKPEFIQVIGDRDLRTHSGFQRNYDFGWRNLGWIFEDYPEFTRELDRPKCLGDIYRFAEALCSDFEYVRVDFYALDDSVLFGEMTFSPANGSYRYRGTWTEELDYKLGALWPFDPSVRAQVLAHSSRP